MNKVKVIKCMDKYNVQVLTSVDNGKTYWYAGNGRFCNTLEEVKDYIREVI